MEKPGNRVMYYLLNGPERAFVSEQLMLIPEDTELPPDYVQEWQRLPLNIYPDGQILVMNLMHPFSLIKLLFSQCCSFLKNSILSKPFGGLEQNLRCIRSFIFISLSDVY